MLVTEHNPFSRVDSRIPEPLDDKVPCICVLGFLSQGGKDGQAPKCKAQEVDFCVCGQGRAEKGLKVMHARKLDRSRIAAPRML